MTREGKIVTGLIAIVFATYLISGITNYWLNIRTILELKGSIYRVQPTIEDYDFTLPDEYKTGECVSKTLHTSVDIYFVEKFESETKRGGYYTEENAIVLSRFANLDVVAHEVSHYVDWAILKKGIRDAETRAYMQGYFTQCVYEQFVNQSI